MTIHLPEELEQFIRAEVLAGRFSSETDLVAEAIRQLRISRHIQAPALAHSSPRKPIWEVADELSRSIPADDAASLPADGASQHDHYIHGVPKHS